MTCSCQCSCSPKNVEVRVFLDSVEIEKVADAAIERNNQAITDLLNRRDGGQRSV